jgi:hypothetical protein
MSAPGIAAASVVRWPAVWRVARAVLFTVAFTTLVLVFS